MRRVTSVTHKLALRNQGNPWTPDIGRVLYGNSVICVISYGGKEKMAILLKKRSNERCYKYPLVARKYQKDYLYGH